MSTIEPGLFLHTSCQKKRMTRAIPWLGMAENRKEEKTRAELAVGNSGETQVYIISANQLSDRPSLRKH